MTQMMELKAQQKREIPNEVSLAHFTVIAPQWKV